MTISDLKQIKDASVSNIVGFEGLEEEREKLVARFVIPKFNFI